MSWDDIAIAVPDEIGGGVPRYLLLEIFPTIDRDAFLCTVFDPGTPAERWEPIRGQCYLCGFVWQECSASPPHSGFGCGERVVTAISPGMTIVIRVFNQADMAACPGRYRFYG